MRLRWYDAIVAVVGLLLLCLVTLYIYHFVSFNV